MKSFKIILTSITFCLLFSFSAQAQIIDSFPWFKAPGKFLTPKIFDAKATFTLSNQRSVISSERSISIANKKITLPRSIKVLNTPISLSKGKQCVEVYCARTSNCSDCLMLWKDANGDRKIQPRRELRCVCKKGGDNCSIKARPIDCK